MNKLVELIANGQISVEELADAEELIERAEFVKQGIEACKKTISFPLGCTDDISCYSYMDHYGEYESWGRCSREGVFSCYSNWGGNHLIGECELTSFSSVFKAFEQVEFKGDLRRFLQMQIEKSYPDQSTA